MTRIDINGYSFEYSERGNSEPLVLVHGSASDYRTWEAQQDAFAQHFRTITYSRRYHWPNKQIAEGADYSMAEHVDDLEALLHTLDAAPAHLVGHSYGAFVCLLLAIRSPQLVRSLVLAEPPVITLFVSSSPKPLEILKTLVARPRTAAAIIKFGAKGVRPATEALERDDKEEAMRVFGMAALGTDTFRSLSEARAEQARANFIEAELLGSGFPRVDGEEIGGIRAPTLLICAESSPRLYHRLMDRLQEVLSRAERIQIPGASHIMHEDNALAYNAEILAFLDGVGLQRSRS